MSYQITAHPKTKPEIKLLMYVAQDFSVDKDSFKESKWRYDTILEYAPLINEISPDFSSFAVNINISEELLHKYPVQTKYEDIRKLNENSTAEYLFMGVLIVPGFSEQSILEHGYRIIEFMRKRNLKNAAIEINFYPRSLIEGLGKKKLKFDVFDLRSEFFNKALPYRFYFDTRNKSITHIGLGEIQSPEDLKPFIVIDGPGQ